MILTNQEISADTSRSSHAVDIFAFVESQEIPFMYFETPYYLAPVPGGEKVYALLRETLRRTRKIGIAYVVIQERQHLAALSPCGPVLVLNTLRFADDVERSGEVNIPSGDLTACNVTEEELATTADLVDSMTKKWDISQYHDVYREDVMAEVKQLIQEATTAEIAIDLPDEDEDGDAVDNDPMHLFQRSAHRARNSIFDGSRNLRQRESWPRSRLRRTVH